MEHARLWRHALLAGAHLIRPNKFTVEMAAAVAACSCELGLRAQLHIPCGTLHFGARVGFRRARDVGERGHLRLADRNALSAFAAAHHTKGGNWRTVKLRARLVERSLAIAGVEGTELPHILRRRAQLGEESEKHFQKNGFGCLEEGTHEQCEMFITERCELGKIALQQFFGCYSGTAFGLKNNNSNANN